MLARRCRMKRPGGPDDTVIDALTCRFIIDDPQVATSDVDLYRASPRWPGRIRPRFPHAIRQPATGFSEKEIPRPAQETFADQAVPRRSRTRACSTRPGAERQTATAEVLRSSTPAGQSRCSTPSSSASRLAPPTRHHGSRTRTWVTTAAASTDAMVISCQLSRQVLLRLPARLSH